MDVKTGVSVLALSIMFLTAGFVFAQYMDSDTDEIKESYGPGVSPHQFDGFYERASINTEAETLEDFENTRTVEDITRSPNNLPDPIEREENKKVEIYLETEEVIAEIDEGRFFNFWTYNGTVPGPTLRFMEGDTVELTLKNSEDSQNVHNIDLHAVTGPGGGAAVTNVAPGESKTFEFEARAEGTFIYHCATHNIPTHMSKGQYGAVIVEPVGGLEPVDKEFTVFQGELYTEESMGEKGFLKHSPEKLINEEPTYYTFNGKPAGLTEEAALNAEVGEEIRIFFGNGGDSKLSTFHLIGEIFDRGYYGSFSSPAGENLETLKIGPGEVGTVEFELEVPGDYTLVDHALARMDRGAWSVLTVEGDDNPDVFRSLDEEETGSAY